jgi:bifunctional enzyme CysN/CysC
MDLVDYGQDAFERIVAQYHELARGLELGEVTFIPLSALHGENVVEPSPRMPWYPGGTLLHHLETVQAAAPGDGPGFRFPVQYVIRAGGDFRGLAGRLASGTVRPGDEVVVLPSARGARVRSVETAAGPRAEAVAGDSVALTLDQELDVSRGDMLVHRDAVPTIGDRFDAVVCWLDERPLEPGFRYLLRHTTRTVQASVQEVVYRADVETLRREPAERLEANDIGAVRIITREPLFFDPYAASRQTGSFILVDPFSNATAAAGTILNEAPEAQTAAAQVSPDVVWESWNVPRQWRESRQGHRAAVVWFTGLPGAGKSTLARALERELFALGCQTMLLDGDQLRHGLCGDLGFGDEDRRENVRRVGEVARLFFEQGSIVLCALVSPFAEDRRRARARVPDGRFFEVFVHADPETCRRRDPKGLYAKADRGEIPDLTGVSSPYEAPETPETVARTEDEEQREIVERLILLLRRAGIVGARAEGAPSRGDGG